MPSVTGRGSRPCLPTHLPGSVTHAMSNAPLRIVVVDDSDDVRVLVAGRLRLSDGFDLVGEGASADEAVALAMELQPDVLLLDMSMPRKDGIDVIPEIRASAPNTRVV